MPKKLKRKPLPPATFPGGIKFARFSSEDDLEKSLEILRTFLHERIREKPDEGNYLVGSHFIKFIPKNMQSSRTWQVSSKAGKHVTIYNYSEILGCFISQRLPYAPPILAVLETVGREVVRRVATTESAAG